MFCMNKQSCIENMVHVRLFIAQTRLPRRGISQYYESHTKPKREKKKGLELNWCELGYIEVSKF